METHMFAGVKVVVDENAKGRHLNTTWTRMIDIPTANGFLPKEVEPFPDVLGDKQFISWFDTKYSGLLEGLKPIDFIKDYNWKELLEIDYRPELTPGCFIPFGLVKDVITYHQRHQSLVEDTTVVTNEHGGSQSHIEGDWTQLPYAALREMAICMKHGAEKYGVRNYRLIPHDEHLNHALRHLVLYCDQRKKDDLVSAFTRLAFALDISEHESHSS
jgi:hypothetical protein